MVGAMDYIIWITYVPKNIIWSKKHCVVALLEKIQIFRQEFMFIYIYSFYYIFYKDNSVDSFERYGGIFILDTKLKYI